MSLENGALHTKAGLPLTKPSLPLPEDDSDKARRKPHRLTDQDRAKSLEARRNRRYVETSLTCNACIAAPTCASFQRGAVCALIPIFKRLPTRNPHECVVKIQEIVSALEVRAKRGLYFEQLDGGKAQPRVSYLTKKYIKAQLLLARLFRELEPGTGTVILEPGTILGNIFGAHSAKQEDERQ